MDYILSSCSYNQPLHSKQPQPHCRCSTSSAACVHCLGLRQYISSTLSAFNTLLLRRAPAPASTAQPPHVHRLCVTFNFLFRYRLSYISLHQAPVAHQPPHILHVHRLESHLQHLAATTYLSFPRQYATTSRTRGSISRPISSVSTALICVSKSYSYNLSFLFSYSFTISATLHYRPAAASAAPSLQCPPP